MLFGFKHILMEHFFNWMTQIKNDILEFLLDQLKLHLAHPGLVILPKRSINVNGIIQTNGSEIEGLYVIASSQPIIHGGPS